MEPTTRYILLLLFI